MNHASAIAAFIGARLQHPVPPCNSSNPRVSTIRVEQYKSKFDDVRVYCELAHPEEVQAAWEEQLARLHAAGNDAKITFAHPTQEFIDRCWERDAEHYRACYLDMTRLVVALSGDDMPNITASADWGILLREDASTLETWIRLARDRDHEEPRVGDKKFASWEELRQCVLGVMKRVG